MTKLMLIMTHMYMLYFTKQ